MATTNKLTFKDLDQRQHQELTKNWLKDKLWCQSSLVEAGLQAELFHWEDIVNEPYDEPETDENGHTSEPEPREIFEWYLIDNWLGEQFEKAGFVVLNTPFMWCQYWGRTTTGQAVCLDYDMQEYVFNFLNDTDAVRSDNDYGKQTLNYWLTMNSETYRIE